MAIHSAIVFAYASVLLLISEKAFSEVALNDSVFEAPFSNLTDSYETPDAVSNQDDDDELRLVNDLFFSGYNKNVRPTKEKELPIEVKFGIAYTQIVDLVGQGSRHFLESF